MKLFIKISSLLKPLLSPPKQWKEIEYFDDKWEDRVKKMSAFILPSESVMDLGCGQMTLKKFLPSNTYIPVDYTKRDEETIVCDLNKNEFPKSKTDVVFISGCLEYVHDYKWLINKVCLSSRKVIISYCSIKEFPSMTERRKNNWVNHLTSENIISLFKENNFNLTESTSLDGRDQIMVFNKI